MTRQKSVGSLKELPVRRTRRTCPSPTKFSSPAKSSSPTKCSSPTKLRSVPFCWGSPTNSRPKDVALNMGMKYYRSFKWKNEKYRVGDFVLVDSGNEPFVAKLEELSDISHLKREMNYQGKVTWYARPGELKGKKLNVEFGSNEVVLLAVGGSQATAKIVDLEAICGHCNVVEVSEETSSCSPEDENGFQQFFCRYTLNRRTLKPLLAPSTKTTETPKKQIYGYDLDKFREPRVELEDIAKSPSRKALRIKLKRADDKENFKISSSPMKTPSKRPQKAAPNTVEKLAAKIEGVTLENQRTPLRSTRNGTTESVCTPKSSKIERTTAATTRSGRLVRKLFSSLKDVGNPKKEGELSDGDLAAEDDDTDIASGFGSNSSSSTELSEDDCSDDDEPKRRASSRKPAGNRSARKSSRGKSIAERRAVMTPSMPSRKKKTEQPQTDIEKALSKLHVCAVPDQLPCREDQFAEIYDFVEGKLVDQVGSCMYISGVPGTGKTATVREVIRTLQDAKETGDVPEFKFIEINGMKLSEPNQAYVQILRQLNGRKATADSAADILTGIFKSKRKSSDVMTVLLVDELDLLWTRKQQVLYNIFDWPTHPNSRLVVVAIANTMDLPERMVMNKVASRMGLSRMTFQPYTFQELQEIVKARLSGLELMDPDAVQFISRKVAALSGDARRALDVCRRAVELSENRDDVRASPSKRAKKYAVTMVHVNMAVKEMFTSSKIVAMQALSFHEKLALRAIVSEFRRTGVEECVFHKVYSQYTTLARLEGAAPLKTSLLSRALAKMASSRLLILSDPRNDFQQKISLNATADDVNFALREQSNCDD